jgi:heptaprenyl diphosphate synthase
VNKCIVQDANFVYGDEMTFDIEAAQRQFLEAVEARIADVLAQHDKNQPDSVFLLGNVARHLCVTPNAKRIRPLLTYWFGLALEADTKQLVDAAVASELIHSASLLHDDVVDDASMRRGSLSANAKWSNSVAVLSGNYLLAIAFDLLANYPTQLTRDGILVVKEMTKAAITEIEVRSEVNTDLATWKSIAIGKTGALFGMCGLAAARLTHNDDAVQRATRLGKHIGIAFQMNDDILDITDASGLKDRYSDISNKEPSLPLIIALKNPDFRDALQKAWCVDVVSRDDVARLGQWASECGAIEETHQYMKKEVDGAIDCLGNLAYTQGGKKIIEWLKSDK